MKLLFAVAAIAIIIMAGCTSPPVGPVACTQEAKICPDGSSVGRNSSLNCEFDPCPSGGVGMPNPASKFCVDAGYENEIRKNADGSEAGYCVFTNGKECEEWAFYRGECTDVDSFELVESPGFVVNPKTISYKFYADGRLVLTETFNRDGNTSTLMAWLKPSDFAAFVKFAKEKGFESLNESYWETCNGGQPCPTDMPSFSLTQIKQGREKSVSVYSIADRPQAVDFVVLELKDIFESAEFVENPANGCTLSQNRNSKEFGCFGCSTAITSPTCTTPIPGFEPVDNSDGMLGSCTVDAAGACAYQPPAQLTQKLCESSGGNWNECGSACRGAPEGTVCTLQCVQYCECGGLVGFDCPTGYFCGDYLPVGAMDPMGICKRSQ